MHSVFACCVESRKTATAGPISATSSIKREDRAVKLVDNMPVQNRFILALTNVVQSYSSRMRNPSHSSPPTRRVTPCDSQPALLSEILSDESDSEETAEKRKSWLIADKFNPPENPPNNPPIDAESMLNLIYQPLKPWAALAHSPIENPVIIGKLHCTRRSS